MFKDLVRNDALRKKANELKKSFFKSVISLATVASILTTSSVCAFANGVTPVESEQDDPNILVIMTEDLNSHFGCFGDEVAVTPNVDALAEEGIMYTNVYCTAGVCAPSRTAFGTGMYQQSVGGQHMRCIDAGYLAVPDEEIKHVAELLRADGYYTFTEDKLDYQFSNMNPGSGPFTIWDTEYAGKDGNSPWSGNKEDKPFFGLINMLETHESRLFGKSPVDVVSPDDVILPSYYPDTEAVRSDVAKLYNCVNNMDTQVGKILQQLEDDGLADDTIVIFTADNGDCLPRAKREVYDSGIHVPMIIRYPDKYMPEGAEPGTVDDRMISFVDMAPTFLSWAGAEIPDNMQGEVVLDIAGQPAPYERQYVYAARDRLDECPDRVRTVRDERYQYVYNFYPGTPGAMHIAFRDRLGIMKSLWECEAAGTLNEVQQLWFNPRVEEELYDTWTDLEEVNNLADDPEYANILERMREAYAEWMDETLDLSDIPEDEMKESFWPGGVQPTTEEPEITMTAGSNGNILITVDEVTPGSSIGYRFEDDPTNEYTTTWRLYTGSFEVPEGTNITFKAQRYGYIESSEVTVTAMEDINLISLDQQAVVNEDIEIKVNTSNDIIGFFLKNESGKNITLTSVEKEETPEGRIDWIIKTKIGTPGERVLSLEAVSEMYGFKPAIELRTDILDPENAYDIIDASFSVEATLKNTPVNIDVKSGNRVSNIGIFNSNNMKMGKTLVSKTVNNSEATIDWVFSMSIGTAGENRIFNVKSENAEGVYESSKEISIIVVD